MPDVFPATSARVAAWMAQPEVLGVVLVGSRSRGHADELSDDDLEVLLTDEAFARRMPTDDLEVLIEGEGSARRLIYDAQYLSLSALEAKAASPHDLDHWPYEQAVVLGDRDGRTAAAVAAAARMDPAFRRARLLHATIDLQTSWRRAEKTAQRGFAAAARLQIARGARALARLLFALEGRWVPMDHWIEPELRTLDDPTGAGPLLVAALVEADPARLGTALAHLEGRLAAAGVPGPAQRRDLFLELIHPGRAEERAVHGLH